MEEDVPLKPGHPEASVHQQVVWRSQHGLRLRLLPWLGDPHEQVVPFLVRIPDPLADGSFLKSGGDPVYAFSGWL